MPYYYGPAELKNDTLPAGTLAVDVETDGPSILGVSYTTTSNWALYSHANELPEFYEHPETVAHNATFDFRYLYKQGLLHWDSVMHDTMIGAHLLNEPELSLKALTYKHFNRILIDYKQ